jgi:hypothetical protein
MGMSVPRKEMLGGSDFGYGRFEIGVGDVGLEFVEDFVALGVKDCYSGALAVAACSRG